MGPPICPAATRRMRHRQPRQRTGGPPGAPSTRKADMEVPGTPTPGRRPGSPPGTNLRMRKEDEPACPGWKLPEDLGIKKMEAPWGTGMEKLSVSVRPPWKRWATAPTPSEEYLDEKKAYRPLRRTRRGFPAKTPPAPRAHLWYLKGHGCRLEGGGE